MKFTTDPPRVTVVGSYPNPEAVAAGMAKISRSMQPISDLVAEAEDDARKAAAQNQRIIFGYGHASIAEHACFSLAIEGIPRSLSMKLLSHRLASYTMLSHRYVPVSEPVFYMPAELSSVTGIERITASIEQATEAYGEIMKALTASADDQATVRSATEDARYVLPILLTTQLGITANARELGLIVRRLLGSYESEAVLLGQAIKEAIQKVAPSLMPDKYMTPDVRRNELGPALTRMAPWAEVDTPHSSPSVSLCSYDEKGEEAVAYAMLFEHDLASNLAQDENWLGVPQSSLATYVDSIIAASKLGLGAYDSMPRAFEFSSYRFMISASEACLHQLIRHRMMSIILGCRAELGEYVTPPSITEIGGKALELYESVCEHLWAVYGRFDDGTLANPVVKILPNSQASPAFVQLNARQLVELSRLRTDKHAQWEIRMVVDSMVEQVRKVHPSIAALCGGRDVFKAREGNP